jgi:hypothetical protein
MIYVLTKLQNGKTCMDRCETMDQALEKVQWIMPSKILVSVKVVINPEQSEPELVLVDDTYHIQKGSEGVLFYWTGSHWDMSREYAKHYPRRYLGNVALRQIPG